MTNPTDFLTTFSQETVSLASAMKSARVICNDAARSDVVEWIDLELNGYHGTGTLFGHRKVPAIIKLVISNGDQLIDDYVFDKKASVVITEGIEELVRLAKLQEALSQQRDCMVYEIHPQLYPVYGRIVASTKSGFRVHKAWQEVPVQGLVGLVTGARQRLEELLQVLDKKPSWW